MNQFIHARFEDGVFKPEDPINLPPNARVRLFVMPTTNLESESSRGWREIEQLWADIDIDSGNPPPSRDQLHDRH